VNTKRFFLSCTVLIAFGLFLQNQAQAGPRGSRAARGAIGGGIFGAAVGGAAGGGRGAGIGFGVGLAASNRSI